MKQLIVIGFSLFFLHCGGEIANAPPPVEPSKKTTPKATHVSWVEVRDGNQFWSTLKLNDKNVALIGTEVCPPCNAAKSWWERKVAPPGWQFVYWRLGPTDDLLTRTFKDIFRNLQERDNLMLPYLSIIEDATDPSKVKAITATFHDLNGCTNEANDFLLMHPQGTIHF
jgi:hypothetical protein